MVDILRESAELGHTPDIERFYRSWSRVKKKQLIIARDLITETRLLKITGEGNEIIVKAFKGADLRDNTDVRLELDSGMSTTKAGQSQFVMQLIKEGFFGDISMRPKVQYELMRRFGMSWVPNEQSVHEDRAGRENSLCAIATQKDIIVEVEGKKIPVPLLQGLFYAKQNEETEKVEIFMHDPYFKFDNNQVHYDSHIAIILSPEFKEWSVANQMVLINHTDMHHFAIEAEKQKAMQEMARMEQMRTGEPPAGPEGQPQPPASPAPQAGNTAGAPPL